MPVNIKVVFFCFFVLCESIDISRFQRMKKKKILLCGGLNSHFICAPVLKRLIVSHPFSLHVLSLRQLLSSNMLLLPFSDSYFVHSTEEHGLILSQGFLIMLYFKVAKIANTKSFHYKGKNIFSFFRYLHERMDVKKTCNHFIIYVSRAIALYTLNLTWCSLSVISP